MGGNTPILQPSFDDQNPTRQNFELGRVGRFATDDSIQSSRGNTLFSKVSVYNHKNKLWETYAAPDDQTLTLTEIHTYLENQLYLLLHMNPLPESETTEEPEVLEPEEDTETPEVSESNETETTNEKDSDNNTEEENTEEENTEEENTEESDESKLKVRTWKKKPPHLRRTRRR